MYTFQCRPVKAYCRIRSYIPIVTECNFFVLNISVRGHGRACEVTKMVYLTMIISTRKFYNDIVIVRNCDF